MKYNHEYDTVISADDKGVIEYWNPATLQFPDTGWVFYVSGLRCAWFRYPDIKNSLSHMFLFFKLLLPLASEVFLWVKDEDTRQASQWVFTQSFTYRFKGNWYPYGGCIGVSEVLDYVFYAAVYWTDSKELKECDPVWFINYLLYFIITLDAWIFCSRYDHEIHWLVTIRCELQNCRGLLGLVLVSECNANMSWIFLFINMQGEFQTQKWYRPFHNCKMQDCRFFYWGTKLVVCCMLSLCHLEIQMKVGCFYPLFTACSNSFLGQSRWEAIFNNISWS